MARFESEERSRDDAGMKNLRRGLARLFPRPLKWLRWQWSRLDRYKPWNLARVRRSMESARQASLRSRTPKLVVFVSDQPRYREAKLAAGLKSAGWDVVLLSKAPPEFDPSLHFSRAIRYRDAWEALQVASEFSPVAFHVFANWFYSTPWAFVQHPPGKIVIDPMDVLGGLTRPQLLDIHYPGQEALERLCFERAHGLCCRSLETQYQKRALGYRFGGKRIFFPDYSLGISPQSAASRGDGEIHVAHIGSITIEKHEPEDRVGHFLEIARVLARDRIHFHLYGGAAGGGRSYEETYAEYLELEKTSPYFHLHRPVPMAQLISELRGYTFAIHVAGILLNFGDGDRVSTRARHDYYTPSRIFDHIAAGLPVILHNGRFLFWLTNRLGIGLQVTADFLSTPGSWLMARQPDAAGRRKLQNAWKAVSSETHIPRLIRFYSSLP
jgi:hypothetical protein